MAYELILHLHCASDSCNVNNLRIPDLDSGDVGLHRLSFNEVPRAGDLAIAGTRDLPKESLVQVFESILFLDAVAFCSLTSCLFPVGR